MIPLEDCQPELTPFGWGVRVGDVTWTQWGPGAWIDTLSAEERRIKMEELMASIVGSKVTIHLGGFMMLPYQSFTVTLAAVKP